MTAIVISGGERERALALVRALEVGAGSAAMGDEEILTMAGGGTSAGSFVLSWVLFGAQPLTDRLGVARTQGRAQVCRALVGALEHGVRIFYGDLGHLLARLPVSVFRVFISGEREGGHGSARKRRRLFGKRCLDHACYDMYLPGDGWNAAEGARAVLERSAVAFGDPWLPSAGEHLRLASDIVEAELDLTLRGLDVEFWSMRGVLTLWNRSSEDNLELEERVRRVYALGSVFCRRGTPPSLFDQRVGYSLSMRVEGQRSLVETVAAVAARNGSRQKTAKHEVVLHGGCGWGGWIVVDLPESLSDPEEAVWRLMALYPGRGLVVPAPRYGWLVSRMGLEPAGRGADMEEKR